MTSVLRAVMHDGKIELLEPAEFPEGAELLVMRAEGKDDFDFWRRASQSALDSIWGNEADDIYAELDKE